MKKILLWIQLPFVLVSLSVVPLTVIGITAVLLSVIAATFLFLRKKKRDSRDVLLGACP